MSVCVCRNFFVYLHREQSFTGMKIRRYPVTLLRRRAELNPETVSASVESDAAPTKKSSKKTSKTENNG